MQNEYFNILLFYTDEKLIEIITNGRDEYVPKVVATAEHLLKSRGYEIEFEGEVSSEVQVINENEDDEPIIAEVLNVQTENEGTLVTMALLFGAIIFILFGLIACYAQLHGFKGGIVGVVVCFSLSVFCLIARYKLKGK